MIYHLLMQRLKIWFYLVYELWFCLFGKDCIWVWDVLTLPTNCKVFYERTHENKYSSRNSNWTPKQKFLLQHDLKSLKSCPNGPFETFSNFCWLIWWSFVSLGPLLTLKCCVFESDYQPRLRKEHLLLETFIFLGFLTCSLYFIY